MTSRSILAGLAALALFATPFAAQAADMPVKAPYYKGPAKSYVSYYNWSGGYAGFNAAYGWGTSKWDFPAVTNYPRGGLFGATLGYNMQVGTWVLGIEGDAAYSAARGSVTCLAANCETQNRFLGTVRGRLGYAVDKAMPYFTGGLAIGDIRATNTNAGFGTATATRIGWTVGAGIETAISGNWTAKFEYLYVDLGRFDCGTACGGIVTPDFVTYSTNILRVGLNYKFGSSVYSKY